MYEIQRSVLFKKLNKTPYKALENAAMFCKMRENPYVEFIHWLHQIMQGHNTDVHCIIEYFDLNSSRVAGSIVKSLEKLPCGSKSVSDISSRLDEIMETTWKYSSLHFNEDQIRTGHIIYTILNTRSLSFDLLSISDEFKKIKMEALGENFINIVGHSVENKKVASDIYTKSCDSLESEIPGKKLEALEQYSSDLTAKAINGELDPVIGREDEVRQIVDILMRRRQNNPILVGEPGVGKSAVIEGVAQKIIKKEVPPCLQDVSLRVLDMGLLQAGASVKGELEQRLKSVIEEVNNSPKPVILFIDEAHTLMGSGSGDAANLLKPALARGTFKTIAATTWNEYKKYIEKDAALTRRFQVVKIQEPSVGETISILRGLVNVMEKHHKVMILDEGMSSAAKFSQRYLTERRQPDKAISLLDTSAARVAISLHAAPGVIEECKNKIKNFERQLEILRDESSVGYENNKTKNSCEKLLACEREILEKLDKQWNEEKSFVKKIIDIRTKLRGKDSGRFNHDERNLDHEMTSEGVKNESCCNTLLSEMKKLIKALRDVQGETPLVHPCVDGSVVGKVISDWTGIPSGKMIKNEIQMVLKLASQMQERVVGQNNAMEAIAKRIKTSRAGFDNPSKPIAVFLLVGPSGVGKTETALALGEALYGGEQNIITINMSEFQEAHTVSTLKGSPPGYVGYGEGGVLTEAVRRRPYSIVLLDEVEKAHSDVHEIFFQVFDKGMMDDAEGRRIDFKNTIILLTSNVGSDMIMDMCENTDTPPDTVTITTALKPELLKVFPPALLGRLVIVPYYPISHDMLDSIIRLQLNRIKERLKTNRDIELTYTESVVKLIASRCSDADSGARMIDAVLTHDILPEISTEYLNCLSEGKNVTSMKISTKGGKFIFNFK
jgi:type VI secretion system protein VasG